MKYSKENNLDIMGERPIHDFFLLSRWRFIHKLLNKEYIEFKSAHQEMLLHQARKSLKTSYSINLIGVIFGLIHIVKIVINNSVEL